MLTLTKEAVILTVLVTFLLGAGIVLRDVDAQLSGRSSSNAEAMNFAPIRDMNVSRDGRFLVTHFNMHQVYVRDANSGQIIAEIAPEIDYAESVHSACMAVSETSGQIVIGFVGGTISRSQHPSMSSAFEVTELHANLNCSPIDAEFSPDGQQIAITTQDGELVVLSAETLVPEWRVPAHRGTVFAVRYAGDGQSLLTAAGDGCVRRWDSATGEMVSQIAAGVGIRALEISRDGEWLAGVSTAQFIITWDARTGEEIWRSEAMSDMPLSLAFSPDAQMIACGLHSGVILLSDVRTNRQLARLGGHNRVVTALQFLDDGQTLVSAGFDGTVRFWNLAQQRQIRQIVESRDAEDDFFDDGE